VNPRAFLPVFLCALAAVRAESNWPQWRGPLLTGTSPDATPPVAWSETKNVRWKTELPGKGHSTPVVWGERVFVTAALPFGDKVTPFQSGAPGEHDNAPVSQKHRFLVLCLDRRDGAILWQRTLREALPHAGGHTTGPIRLGSLRDIYASPVAADGRLYITDRTGVTLVLTEARDPVFLSVNPLDDRLSASPALAGNDLFLRGERILYCLAEGAPPP